MFEEQLMKDIGVGQGVTRVELDGQLASAVNSAPPRTL